LSNKNVKLFPDPAGNYLNISGLVPGIQLKLATLTGQVFFSKPVNNM